MHLLKCNFIAMCLLCLWTNFWLYDVVPDTRCNFVWMHLLKCNFRSVSLFCLWPCFWSRVQCGASWAKHCQQRHPLMPGRKEGGKKKHLSDLCTSLDYAEKQICLGWWLISFFLLLLLLFFLFFVWYTFGSKLEDSPQGKCRLPLVREVICDQGVVPMFMINP